MHAQIIPTAKTCNHHLLSVDVVKLRFLPYYDSKISKTSLSEPGHRSKIQLYDASNWPSGPSGSLRSAMLMLMLMQCFVSIGLRGGENVPLSVSM